jgi:excisionase family DNA binding protein
MAGTKTLDPLAYIENAFLDRRAEREQRRARAAARVKPDVKGSKFRKTKLSAPRPRMAGPTPRQVIDPKLKELIENLPRNLEFLAKFYDDDVTARYYNHAFKETRYELIRRLLDPELTLEEVSRLLGVCPATIRRYTNRGWLEHHRTKGGQRRFRLSAVAKHVEEHGRLPEE